MLDQTGCKITNVKFLRFLNALRIERAHDGYFLSPSFQQYRQQEDELASDPHFIAENLVLKHLDSGEQVGFYLGRIVSDVGKVILVLEPRLEEVTQAKYAVCRDISIIVEAILGHPCIDVIYRLFRHIYRVNLSFSREKQL